MDQLGAVFREEIEVVLQKESQKLEELFDILVPKIKDGARQGTKEAVEISRMWGRPVTFSWTFDFQLIKHKWRFPYPISTSYHVVIGK